MTVTKNEEQRRMVRERYSEIAKSDQSGCCSKSCCCSEDASDSKRVGYSEQEAAAVPGGSDMGLGCGNPQAIASLKPGETVVDLGSGGGFDCFLAAKQAGADGRVVGIDMTPDMVSKARINAEKTGCSNVEFRLGEIENLPAADNFADVIISNCVINLTPEKKRVFQEAFRILKKGGRLAISDVVRIKEMPEAVQKNGEALCGCISGAAGKDEIHEMLLNAGFGSIEIKLKPESREFIKDWLPGSGVEKLVCSAEITAVKKK